jgi:hypothetical protein
MKCLPAWLQPWQHHWAEMKPKTNSYILHYITSMQKETLTSMAALATSLGWDGTKRTHICCITSMQKEMLTSMAALATSLG